MNQNTSKMNLIAFSRAQCDLPVLIGGYLLKRLDTLPVVMCWFALTSPAVSFADDLSNRSIQVKDEETQLARWFSVRESVESPFEYAVSAGYRKDNFKWSIADGGVNVASEVNWKNTVIAELRATGKVNLGSNWLLRGIYSTGAVKSGSNQDSDYAGSDRTQEFSRSNNKTGGAIRDISIGLGRKFRFFDFGSGGGMCLVPLVGLSIHQQSLTMYDGQQTIPASGPIAGLNNSYDAQWKGSWVGLDASLGLGENISLNSTVEYHKVDYSAEANWNLRADFAHPVSFRHVAKGYGVSASAGVSYRFSRNFLVSTSFERQKWNTHAGYDQTNLSYGATNYYTLNPVNWDSMALFFGAVYRF